MNGNIKYRNYEIFRLPKEMGNRNNTGNNVFDYNWRKYSFRKHKLDGKQRITETQTRESVTMICSGSMSFPVSRDLLCHGTIHFLCVVTCSSQNRMVCRKRRNCTYSGHGTIPYFFCVLTGHPFVGMECRKRCTCNCIQSQPLQLRWRTVLTQYDCRSESKTLILVKNRRAKRSRKALPRIGHLPT